MTDIHLPAGRGAGFQSGRKIFIIHPLSSPLLSPALPSLRFLSNSLPNMEANGERRRRLVHAPRSQFQGGARLRRSSPYKETRDPKFAVAEFLYGRRRHAVRERGKDEGRMFRQNEASVENEWREWHVRRIAESVHVYRVWNEAKISVRARRLMRNMGRVTAMLCKHAACKLTYIHYAE